MGESIVPGAGAAATPPRREPRRWRSRRRERRVRSDARRTRDSTARAGTDPFRRRRMPAGAGVPARHLAVDRRSRKGTADADDGARVRGHGRGRKRRSVRKRLRHEGVNLLRLQQALAPRNRVAEHRDTPNRRAGHVHRWHRRRHRGCGRHHPHGDRRDADARLQQAADRDVGELESQRLVHIDGMRAAGEGMLDQIKRVQQ